MPPFLIDHSDACGDFQDAETLSEAQKATIRAWVAASTPEGEPRSLTLPPLPHLTEGTDYRTPDFAPEPQGGAIAAHDEYRCFLLDSGLTAAEVHHRVRGHARQRRDRPPRAGVHGRSGKGRCRRHDQRSGDGGAGPRLAGSPRLALFRRRRRGGGRRRGSGDLGAGPGRRLLSGRRGRGHETTEKVVIQIHYNLADPRTHGQRDQTTIRLRYADTVQRQAPVSAAGSDSSTALGDRDARHAAARAGVDDVHLEPDRRPSWAWATFRTWTSSASCRTCTSAGIAWSCAVDGTTLTPAACIAKVDAWDFHWQKMYFYETPPRLAPEQPNHADLRLRHPQRDRAGAARVGDAERDVPHRPDGRVAPQLIPSCACASSGFDALHWARVPTIGGLPGRGTRPVGRPPRGSRAGTRPSPGRGLRFSCRRG